MSPLEKLYPVYLNGAAICSDTRNIIPGCIFFALKGPSFNGNKFAVTALESGAAFAVIDENNGVEGERLVMVKDVLAFLQDFAHHHRKQLQIPVIGVTGSNGKTTTKELLNKVVSKKFKTLCTKGNLNNHIGVPLTLLSVKSEHEIAIIEMGANHQKEIELLCAIAEPTHVLITNVGKAHLEGFGGFEGVKKGKGEMYEFAKQDHSLVFINNDNSHLLDMLGDYSRSFSYGTAENNDVSGSVLSEGPFVSLKWKSKNNPALQTIHSHLTGVYNFENILSAVAAGVHFGIDVNAINDAVNSYEPDNQRSQVLKRGSHTIILDAYNANPTSMEAALKNFNANFSGKRAVLLGDMFELGESAAKEHQALVDKVEALQLDLVVFVGPNFKSTQSNGASHFFDTSAAAAQWISNQQINGYNILIKGSRGSKMELVLEGLEESKIL
ncbi:MAG: UDP-N-acetylmuramoyl-tripeptide--D-alanyl-D-alanine ligase [Bacteroidota bacterium]|nr:UDP-N-acetylmuramoyl-tripeptide--D-alanyl-D-alanine ligase [Bacteroidota bacterium]